MLAVRFPSSRTRARKHRLSGRTICALALLITCGSTHAQTTSNPAPAAQAAETKAPTSGATSTRARHAAPPPGAASAPADDAPATPVDALAGLRAELAATTADSERGRLQRELINQLVVASDKAAALAELRLLLHEDRFDPPFFYNLGNALTRLGDASAATDAYRKAISQRHGHYARALNNLGVLLTRQGRWDEATDTLNAALNEEHNAYPEASYNLGRLYLLRGEAGLAIRQWQHTLALQPEHADAAAALARAYAEDGDAKRGLAVLDTYAARSTRTGNGVPLPIAYARREIVAADSVVVKEDSARQPEVSERDGSQPDVVRADADNQRAPRMSVAPRPNASVRPLAVDAQTYSVLQRARAAREAGRHEEAVKYYRDVLARSGGYFPPATLELAFALVNLHRNDEARATLETLVAKDATRYPVAYYHLGRLYEEAQQLVRAADNFGRAATLYGDANPQPLVDLSRVREKLTDNAGALAALEAYAQAVEQQGTLPGWVADRLAQLRAKNVAPVAKQ